MTGPPERGRPDPRRSRRRGLLAGLGLWLRMVRAEPPLVLAVAAVLFLAAVLVAGGARLFERVSTDDVRQATSQGLPEDRSLAIETDTRIGAGPQQDRFQTVDRRGETYQDGLPQEVTDVIGPRQFLVESAPYRVGSFPDQDDGPFVLSFRFRYQQGVEDQLTLVDGSLPGPAEPVPLLLGQDCPPDREATEEFEREQEALEAQAQAEAEAEAQRQQEGEQGADDQGGQQDSSEEQDRRPVIDCRVVELPVIQVALTAQTADDLLVELGDRVILRPDPVHPDWRLVFGAGLDVRTVLEVSGIVELSDQSDPFWYGDPFLHRSRVFENPDIRIVDAAGIIDPGQYGQLLRTHLDPPFHYTWRYPVVPDLLDTGNIEPLLAELDKLDRPGVRIVTRLPETLGDHLAQRSLSAALLSTVFAGVVAVAAAAVWVLTELGVARQERSWRLILERGAGRREVLAMGLVNGLAVALPASLAGWAVARVVVPDGSGWLGLGPAAILGAGSVVASFGATATTVVARTGSRGRLVGQGRRQATARRVVRDAVVVVLAVGAVLLVRRRAGGGVLSTEGGPDRLLALTPIVVGAALAVVVLRVVPPLLRLAAAWPSRRRGSVAFLGLRRLADDRRTARTSIAVVLLAVGLAGFGTSLRSSMAAGQNAQIWQSVGADHTVTSAIRPGMTFDAEVQERISALAMTAMGAEFPAADLRLVQGAGGAAEAATSTGGASDTIRADVLAVETEALAPIVAPAPDAPLASLDRIGQDRASDSPIRALVVGRWPEGRRPGSGDRLTARLDGFVVELEVVDLLRRFPGLDPDRPALVIDHQILGRVTGSPLPTTVLRVGPADRADMAGIVEEDGTIRLRSRSDLEVVVADDPLTELVARGLGGLAWFGVLAAAGAALAGLGLTAPARRRDLRLLTTLGFRARQASTMTVIEQVVPVVVAAAAGAALAAILVAVVGPVLDIGIFAGDFATTVGSRILVPVGVEFDGRAMIAVVGLLAAAITAAAAAAARRDRRNGLRTTVDEGDSR